MYVRGNLRATTDRSDASEEIKPLSLSARQSRICSARSACVRYSTSLGTANRSLRQDKSYVSKAVSLASVV
jgi:hypothetical protein